MTKQADDIAFGQAGEEYARDKISKFLGCEIMLAGGYAVLDVVSYKKRGEIKSRRASYYDYKTFMIGKNKIDAFTDPDIQYYVFFNLTDGLYAVEYDPVLFETFEVKKFQRFDRDCNDKEHECIYIPRYFLKPID